MSRLAIDSKGIEVLVSVNTSTNILLIGMEMKNTVSPSTIILGPKGKPFQKL